MTDIFVSYRRQDAAGAAGRLADRLAARYGADAVFMDRVSIGPGEDFADAIRLAIVASRVLLAVVGPRWLDAASADGRRRLDDPADHVRIEIETALAEGVPVVPVLVEGAAMPAAAALPRTLAGFARCQAVELSDARWQHDFGLLAGALETRFDVALPASHGAPALPRAAARTGRAAASLLNLLTHPRRLIARRRTGSSADHARALAFLLGAILAGNAAILAGIDYRPPPGDSIAGVLAAGEFFGLLAFVLLTLALVPAWRLVGVRAARWRRAWVVAAYLYGGVWIGLAAGLLLLGTALLMIDAALGERVLALLRLPAGEASPADLAGVEQRIAAGLNGPRMALFLLANAVWLATLAWACAAWGALRDAFGTGRIASTLALLAWLGLLWGGALLVGRLA